MDHNDLKLFYYTDSSLMDEMISVKFDAHVMVGAIRLKAKLCSRPDDMADLQAQCNYTLDELMEPDPEEKTMMHQASEEESPDHNLCFPNQLLSSQLRN